MADAPKEMAVIGEDAFLSGRVTGQDLLVLGRVEGQIELRGRLRVGPKGRAQATVRAHTIEIEGELEGDVRAEVLTLAQTARARGTFVAKRLSVQEGAVLEGHINPQSSTPPVSSTSFRPPVAAPVPAAAAVPVPFPTAATDAVAGPAEEPEAKPEGDPSA
jgi:cytoskeletal protein CcmA (bactofilin family)